MKITVIEKNLPSRPEIGSVFLGGSTATFENFVPECLGMFQDYCRIKDALLRILKIDAYSNPEYEKLLSLNDPYFMEAYTNGERRSDQEKGYYYTKLKIALDQKDLETIYENEIIQGSLAMSWFNYHEIACNSSLIKMDDDTYMIRHLGKYASGLRILIDIRKESLKPQNISSEELGIYPDGVISFLTGDYFKSKKGLNFFKVKKEGKYKLFRQDWGGSGNSSCGMSFPAQEALFYNRRSSSGRGKGYTWAVYPYDWNALSSVKEEKIEFHNVKFDLREIDSERKWIDDTRSYFQMDYQSCKGVRIYLNDLRPQKKGRAHVVCRTKGEYTEIDFFEEKSISAEPDHFLVGVYLYSNTKNWGASSHIDIDESMWKTASSGNSGGIRRKIMIFIIEKGKKVTLRGARQDVFKA